jgi:hypothetical protein
MGTVVKVKLDLALGMHVWTIFCCCGLCLDIVKKPENLGHIYKGRKVSGRFKEFILRERHVVRVKYG